MSKLQIHLLNIKLRRPYGIYCEHDKACSLRIQSQVS
jgi:hypothetical protein